MSVPLSAFPFATPYDPSEDPPTSIDPLGTVTEAERLADLLLPGLTARMWRSRLLTFSAVTALVADRTASGAGREDVRDAARLAFERIAVSAFVRHAADAGMEAAIRRVPGTDRARAALRLGEPLTSGNFLKGQMINGPTGVMARLARHVGIVDEEHHLREPGRQLLDAWSTDQDLRGVCDEFCDGNAGARWVTRMAQATRDALNGTWPGNQSGVWRELVTRLRPDDIGTSERRNLVQLLRGASSGSRRRVLDLLKKAEPKFRALRGERRGIVERAVLHDGLLPLLDGSEADLQLRVVVNAIEAFEQVASLLQSAFDTLRWSLSSRGAAPASGVAGDATAPKALERTRKRIGGAVASLDQILSQANTTPCFDYDALEPLRQLREDANQGRLSTEHLVEAVLGRHRRVQRDKRKGCWIESGPRLTLMPGFGLDDDAPPSYDGVYLHPFRVLNAYAMLTDLGEVRGGLDAEA